VKEKQCASVSHESGMHIVLFISNLYQINWNLFAFAILVLTISIVLVFLLLGELLRWILCLALNQSMARIKAIN